jgi:hypothetical protein
MLNIRTRIWTDLNPSKRISSRIRSENIRTVFIPTYYPLRTLLVFLEPRAQEESDFLELVAWVLSYWFESMEDGVGLLSPRNFEIESVIRTLLTI